MHISRKKCSNFDFSKLCIYDKIIPKNVKVRVISRLDSVALVLYMSHPLPLSLSLLFPLPLPLPLPLSLLLPLSVSVVAIAVVCGAVPSTAAAMPVPGMGARPSGGGRIQSISTSQRTEMRMQW